MLKIQGILDLLNDRDRKCCSRIYRWRQVYYGMSLHIDGACPAYRSLEDKGLITPNNYFGEAYQEIFNNVLYSRHPREAEVQRQWRLSQHRPFTQQPFSQVIQVLAGSIFQDSGYGIDIKNPEDHAYIWGNNFEGKNLVGYISDKLQNVCTDPNGVFVVIPNEPGYKTTTQKVEPKVYWIPSRFIEYKSEDEIIFFIDEIAWCVNPYGYFRFKKTEEGVYERIQGETRQGYFGHMLLRIPHHTAGGEWNTQGFYESWLRAGKAWADEFVSNKSAEQHVNKEASHSYIAEASVDCPECDAGGKVNGCKKCSKPKDDCECGENYEHALLRCSYCGGSGQMSRNPGDHIIVPVEDFDKDPVRFITPNISINQFHKENNADLFNALYRALYQNYIEQAQSGVAKDKDMEAKYLFILTIANDLFDRVITGLITDILSLRNVVIKDGKRVPDPGEFIIRKPSRFHIKTSFDLLEEYKEAYNSGIPNSVLAKKLEDYTDKEFGGDEVTKKKVNFINQRDPLALEKPGDVQILVTNGAATRRDWQFSKLLSNILDKVIRGKTGEWFQQATYEQINREVETIFATYPEPADPTIKISDQNKV